MPYYGNHVHLDTSPYSLHKELAVKAATLEFKIKYKITFAT